MERYVSVMDKVTSQFLLESNNECVNLYGIKQSNGYVMLSNIDCFMAKNFSLLVN